MAAMFLIVGLLNFVLGYGLALVLADPPFFGLLSGIDVRTVWQAAKARFRRTGPPAAVAETAGECELESPPTPDETAAPPTVALDSELPDSWQQTLRDNGLRLNSLAVGVAHLSRLEGAVYREHLLATETRARLGLNEEDPLTMEQLAADLKFINGDWASKQRQAAELVEECEGRHGPVKNAAAELARFLRDQAGQMTDIDREIHALNFRSEGTAASRRLLAEVQQLLRLADGQRDEARRLLGDLLRGEGKLNQLDEMLHHDSGTGLLCGLGLEVLFAQEFPAGARPTAAMLISLDRFGKLNQRLGSRAGDQVLKSISQFITELASASFGASLVSRHRGDQFLIWIQEPAVVELAASAEHFRQSFEAANFHCQGMDLSLTATISAAAVAAEDGLDQILAKLAEAHATAMKAGQNRCASWENGAATLALPPAIPITARNFLVETTAA